MKENETKILDSKIFDKSSIKNLRKNAKITELNYEIDKMKSELTADDYKVRKCCEALYLMLKNGKILDETKLPYDFDAIIKRAHSCEKI